MSISKNSSKAFRSLLSDFRIENASKKLDSTLPDIVKPKIELDFHAKELVSIFSKAERQTIIHCKCPDGSFTQIIEKGKIVVASGTKPSRVRTLTYMPGNNC